MKIIIFTDLDGSLLDHQNYSYEKAKPALERIKETKTPVIFVTSKTFPEVKSLQKKMGLWKKEPFIVEKGGALFIPRRFLKLAEIKKELRKDKRNKERIFQKDGFWGIEFGTSYKKVRKVLKEAAKETGLKVLGIGDMTIKEFSADCGLSLKDAQKAKQRMYQEGFEILVSVEKQKEAQQKIKQAIKRRGFYLNFGGRYYQIAGHCFKIKALQILINLFKKKYKKITTLGLGNTEADLEFMKQCNYRYLIKNPKRLIKTKIKNKKIHYLKEAGPKAWNKVVLNHLAKVSAKD